MHSTFKRKIPMPASLLFLLTLLTTAFSDTIPPTFITTISSSFETGSAVLTASTISTSGNFSTYSSTITFLNTYSATPQFGHGFSFISSQWPMTTSATQTIIDVSGTSSSSVSQVVQLNFTASAVSLFSINYIVCSSSFFLDIRTSYNDLTSTTIFSSGLNSVRSTTLNLPAKTKSNSSNTVAAYTTIGLSMMRAKDTFEFQLATLGFTSTTINVNLTVMANNGMRFIRFAIFNYEAIVTVITSPYFLDIGFGSNLGGSVPDSSGLALTTTGTIFLGMADWALSDYYAVISYNMSISGTIYSLAVNNTVTRTQTTYIWYRQAVCPTYYYNISNTCSSCHYSCLTCNSATATGCTSCDGPNSFRTYVSSNNTCPCMTNYLDTGTAICQEILCYGYCTSCTSDYYCSACSSGTYRTLSGGACVCASYTIDLYSVDSILYTTCQICYPTCVTCTDILNRYACATCSLSRDHRSFNNTMSSCDCIDGYFENPNLTTKTSSFVYKGVPCLACSYSCATCTGNTTCLTCNASLNRVYNNTTKLCSCNTGYYDNFLIQSCFSCPYSCSTCTSATVCLTCPSTRTLTNNLCPCQTGFYESGILLCQACNYTCKTCSNGSTCTTCNSGYFRSMSNGSCLCAIGYYDNYVSPICLQCDTTCYTCNGGNSNNCTSCNSFLFRTLTSNKTCACMTGYYLDQSTNTCTSCYYTCESCSDGSNCLTCSGTNFRVLSGTSCICNNKYYDDGGNQLCKSCPYYCLTCTNSSICLTCDPTRNSSNVVTCPCLSGYYDDGASTSCPTCLASCLTCNNANNCTTCQTNRVITTVASCVCMTRTFEPYCQSCSYSCLQCLGVSTACTSCNGTAMRYLNSTLSKCLCYQGFYDDGSNELCLACHLSCLTCASASSCLTCPVNRVTNGSYCSCISTYFENGQNYSNCLPCHYSCLSCSSYSVCTSCDSASYRISNANTTLCICSPGYYDNLVSVLCQSCYSICMTCSSYFVCTGCNSTQNFYLSNGTCLCNTGYYFDSTTKSCIACDSSCNTCTNGSMCATCKPNRTQTSTFCPCTSGLYDNPSTSVCSPCSYPCITCVSSSSNCTSCDSNRTLNSTTGLCVCSGSTYDTGLNCLNCLSTCQTCSTGSTCTTCLSGSSRVLDSGTNLCVCPTGYHDQNGTSLICKACNYSCATCINSLACSTCYTGRTQDVGGFCVCPTTYVYDNGVNPSCISCHFSCYTCSVISTNCTSCLASTYRTLINNTCSCQVGYFDDLSSATCQSCHYSCQQCTSASSCTICNATNFRYIQSGPLCSCMTGYYDVTNSQLCPKCSYTCLTCVSSESTCLTCPSLRTFLNASSSCPCSDGYYDVGVVTCVACLYSCATCTNGTTCLTCPSTRIHNLAQACICVPGKYDVNGQNACSSCLPSCFECSSYQVCTLCDTTNTFRQLKNTSCICPAGYYDSSSTGNYTCQACDRSCATCVSQIQCTSCNSNYQRVYNITTSLCSCASAFFDNGVDSPCVACPYDCLTCSNSTTCLTCPSVRYLGSDNRCYCFNATFSNGSSCQSCPVECLTCTSSSYCTSCVGNRSLSNNACVCPTGQYSVAGTSTCNSCDYSCTTCLAQSQCSSCNASNFRYLTSTFCLCMARYYDDGTNNQTCQPCYYSCQLCSNGTTCLTCNSVINRVLNTVTKLCDCASGYYEDPTTKACVKCDVSCVTCTSGTVCTSCNINYNRILNGTTNKCDCQAIGYFDTYVSAICSSCDYSCYSCSGTSTYCTTCLNSTKRTLTASSCLCNTGFYDVVNQPICLTCSVRCVSCLGSSDNCTQCSAVNYRNSTPTCSCFNGFYDNGTAVCAACSYVCLTCMMSQSCTSCDLTTSHRTLNNASGLCECISQYYDAGSNICQSCSYSCLTCAGSSTTCLTCPSTRVLTLSQCLCQQKFYDDMSSLQCLACDYTCQSCVNGSSCFSCNSAKMRTFNSSTYLCSCQTGYYDIGVQSCAKCDSSCYTCTNSSSCSSCPPNINKTLNASSGSNFCVCLYGYYENTTAGLTLGYNSVCNPCYYSCTTCTGQASYCTLCDNSTNRYLTTARKCACNSGYFDIYGQATCIACFTHCLTCTGTSNTSCLSCDNSTYYLSGSCQSSCPQFYNISESTRTCASCPSDCLSCPSSLTVCSQCNSPFFIFSYNSSYAVCVSSCPTYYYEVNSTCFACLSPCLACTAAYTCTSCISLYYLSNGNCNPCHSLCLTCSGSTALDCLTCVPNYILKGSVCQKLSCSTTQYVQSTTGCVNCTATFPNSLTCLSTGPTSCQTGYLLSNNSCLTCTAVTGYTYDSASGKCKDYCGDGIIITDLCDDGNTLNGDGCSSVCKIESGWTCPNNTCSLAVTPTVKVVSLSNNPISHTISLVLELNVGIRLVTGNFILAFSSITKYTYTVSAVDIYYTKYQLNIVYYQTAANNNLVIQIKSPISRLLLTTNTTLSISISLSVTVPILTNPPAIYVPTSTSETYSKYLLGFIGSLHTILLITAAVFVMMKLKVMLLIIDALNSLTIIYILAALGMYNVTLLSYESMRGLQPFIHSFGSELPSMTNMSYFSYTSNFFGTTIIQAIIVTAIFILSVFSDKKDGDESSWHYYRIGCAFAFSFDFLLSCFSTFFWNTYTSYESSYSWMFSVLAFIYLCSETIIYYSRIQDPPNDGKKVLPAISFITNDLEIRDKNKEGNIFEFDEDVSREKKKGILSQWSDQKTEVAGGSIEVKQPEEVFKYHDLAPSTETQYSMRNSNHISSNHLPLFSLIFALPFTIIVNIQNPIIRSALFLVVSIIHLVCVIVFRNSRLKSLRNIKLIIFSSIYTILSILALATSVNSQTIDLIKMDGAIVSIVIAAILFNIVVFIGGVLKSEGYREYLINKRNEEIMERTKKQNQARMRIYTKADFNKSGKAINPNSEEPQSFEVKQQAHEIQVSQQPQEEKQIKLSSLKKRPKDDRTMLQGNNQTVNNQIDHEISDLGDSDFRAPSDLLNEKQIMEIRRSGLPPRSPNKRQGNRIKAINSSEMSLVSRKGETPSLFFENSLERVDEEQGVKRNVNKANQKEDVSKKRSKRKKRPNMDIDEIDNDEIEIKEEGARQSKLKNLQKVEVRDSRDELGEILSEMQLDMPRGCPKIEDESFHRRVLSIEDISSIHEEREQFAMQEREPVYEESVFNKILNDYQKYKHKKIDRKKLKNIKQKKLDKI